MSKTGGFKQFIEMINLLMNTYTCVPLCVPIVYVYLYVLQHWIASESPLAAHNEC